jgi:hypothetical protein
MKRIYFLFSLLMFSFCANSQTLRDVDILTESDDEDMRECNISYSRMQTAAESALRYNRVNFKNSTSKVILYINSLTLTLNRNNCVANVKINFERYESLYFDYFKKFFTKPFILCEKDALLVNSKTDLQENINRKIRDMIDSCISEIEK